MMLRIRTFVRAVPLGLPAFPSRFASSRPPLRATLKPLLEAAEKIEKTVSVRDFEAAVPFL